MRGQVQIDYATPSASRRPPIPALAMCGIVTGCGGLTLLFWADCLFRWSSDWRDELGYPGIMLSLSLGVVALISACVSLLQGTERVRRWALAAAALYWIAVAASTQVGRIPW